MGVRLQQHLGGLQQVSVHGLAASHPEVPPHGFMHRWLLRLHAYQPDAVLKC